MPIHHPNKQKNLKALPQERRYRQDRSNRVRNVLTLPAKPITSSTWRKDRTGRVTLMPEGFVEPRWGSRAMTTYTTACRSGVFVWNPLRCLCDACDLHRARVFKDRPAKDVERARLRDFKQRRSAYLADI